MSAALKDGIKSAMSGVGVALSGDMLSKCEFRGLLLYLSTKIESKISPTGPGGRPAPATSEPGKNDGHLERRRNKEIYVPILSVGIRGKTEIANLLRALGCVEKAVSLCSLQSTSCAGFGASQLIYLNLFALPYPY